MDKGLVEHFEDVVHFRNPINVWQIGLLVISLYSEGSEDRFVVVQHFWCRKICHIVCRVTRKWMEFKFLYRDVNVVFLANKGIVVGRNYNKILMETGKLMDNIRVTKNVLGSGVDRMFKSSDYAYYHITDRLDPFRKSVEFDILFLGQLPMNKSILGIITFTQKYCLYVLLKSQLQLYPLYF